MCIFFILTLVFGLQDWYLNLECSTPKGLFHKKIQEHSTKRKVEVLKMENYYSCDPAAMMVALDPSSVLESTTCFCSVELQGTFTRGQMVVDWRGVTKKRQNVEIILKVDAKKVMKRYEDMLV